MTAIGVLDMQRVATRDPADGVVKASWWEELDYAYDDSDVTIRFGANATNPVLVKEVVHVVLTACDGTLDVGDGTDVDYWIDQLDITEATPGDVTSSLLATNATPKHGRWYTTNGQVTVTIAGSPTGGTGKLLVNLIQL